MNTPARFPTTAHFGARLRELRESAGLSQAGLAKATGLNRVTLADYERGERSEPTFATALALASALGVDVGALAESPGTPVPRRKKIPGNP
jgi:transcriptional regulator with XRE-family HTH domain